MKYPGLVKHQKWTKTEIDCGSTTVNFDLNASGSGLMKLVDQLYPIRLGFVTTKVEQDH